MGALAGHGRLAALRLFALAPLYISADRFRRHAADIVHPCPKWLAPHAFFAEETLHAISSTCHLSRGPRGGGRPPRRAGYEAMRMVDVRLCGLSRKPVLRATLMDESPISAPTLLRNPDEVMRRLIVHPSRFSGWQGVTHHARITNSGARTLSLEGIGWRFPAITRERQVMPASTTHHVSPSAKP